MILVYIDILLDKIKSSYKISTNDTSPFELNNNLQVMNNWGFQWKIQFNPDPNKQVQEVYFSKKT